MDTNDTQHSGERLAAPLGSAAWVKTAERTPTKSDADCEGCVWTWQEYHAQDEEDGEWRSLGFMAKRHHWQSVVRDHGKWIPYWKPSDLRMPEPPNNRTELRLPGSAATTTPKI